MSREETLSHIPGGRAVHRVLLRSAPAVYANADLLYQAARAELVSRGPTWRGTPRAVPAPFTRTSDTLFILGSGASINALGDAAWEEVSRANSLGLNFWLLHRFIPTAYVQEWIADADSESLDGQRAAARRAILHRRQDELRGQLVYFRAPATRIRKREPFHPSDVQRQLPLADLRIQISADLNLLPLDTDGFARTIGLAHKLGFFKASSTWRYLVSARGTVLWSVLFALRLGFKRVVLVGVDLTGTEYFYENPSAPGMVEGLPVPPSTQSGPLHRTNSPDEPGPTMEEILTTLDRLVLRPRGIELRVGHRSSVLARHFPVHPWAG